MTPKRPLERLVSDSWRRVLSGLAAYPGSPAAAYLTGRGIGEMFPCCCGVKYHPRWYGYGPAVVFPIRDQADVLVAAQGRYLDPAATPKARTAGPVKRGVFQTPGALGQEAVLITEAPIDALSLAICGFPAVALIGTHFPDWLPAACRGKRVLIATDADEAGDQAAERLCYAVAQCGLRAERLKPIGAKDWNEVLLTLGREALATALTNAVKRR